MTLQSAVETFVSAGVLSLVYLIGFLALLAIAAWAWEKLLSFVAERAKLSWEFIKFLGWRFHKKAHPDVADLKRRIWKAEVLFCNVLEREELILEDARAKSPRHILIEPLTRQIAEINAFLENK